MTDPTNERPALSTRRCKKCGQPLYVAETPAGAAQRSNDMEGLTEGRIVHFVLPEGQHRAAIIVRVWRQGDGTPPANGYSNLAVFMDGTNDYLGTASCIKWETSVEYSAEPKPRTWHWIEKA